MLSNKGNKQKKKTKVNQKALNPFNDLLQVRVLLACVCLSLVTYFIFNGAMDNDFVDWDDFTYVIENDLVRSVQDMEPANNLARISAPGPYNTTVGDIFRRSVSSNYHPLTILSMRWNNNVCQDCVYGISARPFIFWNLILHIINVLLVFMLALQLSRNQLIGSALVAAIFALHPMHVESVVWVSERKDVLYTCFFLAGLLSYLKYMNTKRFYWWLGALILFLLSCLSKGMAVVFPLVLILLHWYIQRESSIQYTIKNMLKPTFILSTVPFFIISMIFGLLAFNIQSGNNFLGILETTSNINVAVNEFDAFGIWQRFQFATYGFCQYIMKFFVPHHLSTYHTYPTQIQYDANLFFSAAPFVVIAFIGLIILSLKKTKHLFFGIVFFLITIILVLQFVSVGTVIMADRYTYLPYLGLAFGIVFTVLQFVPKKSYNLFYILTSIWIAFLSYRTVQQIETWESSDTLWSNVIELAKTENGVIHETMAMPYATRGSYYGKMSEYFARVKQDPNQQQAFLNKAATDFKIASQLNSKDSRVYKGLGNVAGIRGQFNEAIEYFSTAIQLSPNDESSFFNRAITYSNLGRYQEAIADYNEVLKLSDGTFVGALVNRGITYKNIGDLARARTDFERALQLEPTNSYAKQQLVNLGQQ